MPQSLNYLRETASQTAGPYVHIGLAPGAAGFDIYDKELGWDIAGPNAKGERIRVEGLVIDKQIHLGHLKWTLETFLKAFFERDDITLRLRPSYFPFTEPSVEVDVGYANENGRRVVGGSGDAPGHDWMELLGSGMVNRRVLQMGGFDPDKWQGFAWGLGVDRLAMLKYGMNDLRAFFDGDPRWLTHYGFSPYDQPTLSAGVGAAQ